MFNFIKKHAEKKEKQKQDRKKIKQLYAGKKLYTYDDILKLRYPNYNCMIGYEQIEASTNAYNVIKTAKLIRKCLICGKKLYADGHWRLSGYDHILDVKNYLCSDKDCDFSMEG